MSTNPAQLREAAARAAAGGDFRGAEELLRQWLGADPRNLGGWLQLAAVRRQLGNVDGAFQALHSALELDPRSFPALLMSASMLDRLGQAVPAARAYGIALAQCPPDELLDPATRQAVQRARLVHDKYQRELGAFVHERVEAEAGRCSASERRRVDAFIRSTLRLTPQYRPMPTDYYYPGLPTFEFYGRELFPWIEAFEASTADVQAELAHVLAEDRGELAPYIQYDSSLPLDQWRELNHNPSWSAYHFYEQGRPVEHRCGRAPRTVAAFTRLPQAVVPKRSPTAMFSVLQPRTRIPPHHGIANFRLVVHLPLVMPPHCGFRVGSETREWRIGEAWVFDDTIEHEAWNDSDQLRIILICDIWHPHLSPEEQAAISQVIAATDVFNGIEPSASI